MSLIEGIGDEVTHFFLLLFSGFIAYIAWWSTNISEQRQYRTVLLLDRRSHPTRSILRVRVPSRQLTNHTETVTISEGTSSNSTTSVQTEESSDSALLADTSSASTIVASSSSSSTSQLVSEEAQSGSSADIEGAHIIERMDADTQSELRQRRLAHFEGASAHGANTQQSNESQSDGSTSISSASPTNLECSIENGEAEICNKKQDTGKSSPDDKSNDIITIKLKYINDDIKIVDGRLEELLGDFKRRHFMEEINANKAVKLIFNGQVLRQDQHSLQSCGLFDNCVVHCLIHQKRPSLTDRDRPRDSANETNPPFLRNNSFVHITNVNNNNQGVDWDLGNFLFFLVSFILLAAWYFRYVYAHLYTVTATVGLIIITGVFSIVLLGVYFPDNEVPDANFRIRVTRTERIEVQQQ